MESIHFLDAWRIPGVAAFAFCLFFSKLIAYTFLYWLPYYIKSTPIEGRKLSAKEAGDLSVLFDVGGVAGGECLGSHELGSYRGLLRALYQCKKLDRAALDVVTTPGPDKRTEVVAA